MIGRLTTALFLSTALSLPAAANTLDRAAEVDVLPGWRTETGTHMAALRIRLAPGWKTYWRAPGESGIPPRFGWDGSQNLSGVTFHWPVPQVFEQNGMRSIGYKHELILPMEFSAPDPTAPITLNSQIELGVCLDICMPLTLSVKATLPATGTPDPAIRAALSHQPASAATAGVRNVACKAEPIADGLRLTASLDMAPLAGDEVSVVELSDQTIWISETETARKGRTLTAQSDLVPPSAKPFLLDRSDVRITVIGNGQAVQIDGCTAAN